MSTLSGYGVADVSNVVMSVILVALVSVIIRLGPSIGYRGCKACWEKRATPEVIIFQST